MYKGNTVGVVVPAYNESGLVGTVIETLPSFVDRAFVVDDCSTDTTWDEITAAAERENAARERVAVTDGGHQNQRIVPIQHERNRGVGGAIKTGYMAARDEGLDVVTVMGGDGQMDPSILDRIIDPVVEGRADYAKGNRLLRPGDQTDMPAHRVAGNYLLTILTRVAAGYWTVGDPQNGYTAISNDAIEDAAAEEMFEFYGYCNDLLVKLNIADARVADVPMAAKYDEETSHIELSSYVPRVSAMLARNFCWRLYAKYLTRGAPAVPSLYGLSALSGLTGLVVAFVGVFGNLSVGQLGTPILLLGGSMLAFLAGALLDRRKNSHLDFVVGD